MRCGCTECVDEGINPSKIEGSRIEGDEVEVDSLRMVK